MNDQDFQKLVQSIKQMGSIMRGEDPPHRKTVLTAIDVKALRERLNLTEADFSAMIGLSTLLFPQVANTSLITFPCTSVRRRSMPLW